MLKKILICCIIAICLLLVGCEASFDWDKSIDRLKKEGYVVIVSNDTDEELAQAKSVMVSEIKFSGVDVFEFNLLKTAGLTNAPDSKYPVSQYQLMMFETNEQAQLYKDYYVATRTEGSLWKVAVANNIVVISNQTNADDVLNIKFN